jgi:hypothetical protein
MQVADCYIHVKYRTLRLREFQILSERLLHYATDLMREVIPRGRDLDFTFEEGTLFHRLVVMGGLLIGTTDVISKYRDLKESIIEMVHDGEEFSDKAIREFRELTGANSDQDIYKRTSSRDMNRLSRIVSNIDQAADTMQGPELTDLRTHVIHDLAALARANPNDPDVEAVFT